MSQYLKNHYRNIITYDLLTKLNFTNIHEITKIQKIHLNIGFKNANIEKKKLINIITLLKIISNQTPSVTNSKKNNIFLKIKKGSIIGCKITLRKTNIFSFLEKFILFVQPSMKENFKFSKDKNILNFQIKNVLNFFELETEFLKFKDIPSIDISIHTNSQNNKELLLILNSFNILTKKN